MRSALIATVLFTVAAPSYIRAASVSDLKAATCCCRSSIYDCDYCEYDSHLDKKVSRLVVGQQLPVTGSFACECIKKWADYTVTYLGKKNGILEFDAGSDGEPDVRIDVNTIKDKDKFSFGSCSDCSSLGSVCASVTSYIVFRVPAGVRTGTGSGDGDGSDGEGDGGEDSSLSAGGKFGISVLVIFMVGVVAVGTYIFVQKRKGNEVRWATLGCKKAQVSGQVGKSAEASVCKNQNVIIVETDHVKKEKIDDAANFSNVNVSRKEQRTAGFENVTVSTTFNTDGSVSVEKTIENDLTTSKEVTYYPNREKAAAAGVVNL